MIRQSNWVADVIGSALKITYPFSLVIGFGFIFIYCRKVGYMPIGISVGDSLVALFVSAWAYLLYFFLFLIILQVSTPLIWLANKITYAITRLYRFLPREKRKKLRLRSRGTIFKTPSRLFCVIIYLFFCLLVLLHREEAIDELGYFWFDVVFFSFVVPCIKMGWRGVAGHGLFLRMPGVNKLLIGLFVVVLLVLISESNTYVSEKIMESVGIRRSEVVVQFDDAYHGFIGRALLDKSVFSTEKGEGFSISAPGLCAERRQEIYFPSKPAPISADVLFSGIGAYHLVEIQGCRFLVPNERVMVAYKIKGS